LSEFREEAMWRGVVLALLVGSGAKARAEPASETKMIALVVVVIVMLRVFELIRCGLICSVCCFVRKGGSFHGSVKNSLYDDAAAASSG